MNPDQQTLREWRARLTLDPLDPCDPNEKRYVPLNEAGRGAVDDVLSLIELALGPTTQLLSGPSGSGKTTELKRLSGQLEAKGFTVVMVDILAFVNQSSEVDVTEFLIALALALDEGLDGVDETISRERWPDRFRSFLQRIKVSIAVGPVTASGSAGGVALTAPGMGVELDLKKEVKSSEPFVVELRKKLAFHLGDLHQEVADFCAQRVSEHVKSQSESPGVVLIVDSLEKVRGTSENDEKVQESIERLLIHHSDKLRFKSHHTVYTVPPYLMFTDPGSLPFDGSVRPVSIPHVEPRDASIGGNNLEQLRTVVSQRIPWSELLNSGELLDRVIRASGGHLRDLFTILQEIIMLVNARRVPLPAEKDHVNEAISKVSLGFSSITEEDAAFLRRVDQEPEIRPKAQEVGRLARLLHTHMVLAHQNTGTWYEVHPLARAALRL